MRIRMRTTIQGPDITAIGGSIVDLPNDRAIKLVKAGYAEPVRDAPKEMAVTTRPASAKSKEPEKPEPPKDDKPEPPKKKDK